uniref:Uncharacterized protein n=2 Tax=Acrobeloides nanus TaxID=290746 RepID=A0A914D3T6_9BILA
MTSNQKARILGFEVSHTEACIIEGTVLCVLAIFGYSACYNVDHCPLVSPYYTGNIFGKYIPTFCIFTAGILIVLASIFQKPVLFALATVKMWTGIAGVIGMFICAIVEAGEFKKYIHPDLSTGNGQSSNIANAVGFYGPSSKFWIWLAHVFIQGLFTIFILVLGASYSWQGFKLLNGGGRTYSRPENIALATSSKQQQQQRFEQPQVRVEQVERIEHSQRHHEEHHEELQRTKYDEVPI